MMASKKQIKRPQGLKFESIATQERFYSSYDENMYNFLQDDCIMTLQDKEGDTRHFYKKYLKPLKPGERV